MYKFDEKKTIQDLAKEFNFDICKITDINLPINTSDLERFCPWRLP